MERPFLSNRPCRSGPLVLALLCLLGPATAASAQVAMVENLGDTLVFHPTSEFKRLVLTVTGPCDFRYRQAVTSGEPSFALGMTTIDGAYTYELVREESIDTALLAVLQTARANDDAEPPRALCRDGMLPGPPLIQSAGFQVSGGTITLDTGTDHTATIAPSPSRVPAGGSLGPRPTGPEPNDTVINDDLIVDGSACIGVDCVNGETFSFDTLRLKETVVRIAVDDTSVVPGFASNDWKLTFNESTEGGAARFSVDDVTAGRTPFTVEGGAHSHALYVDDQHRVGNRTATPLTALHSISSDSPTVRLEQDSSHGYSPQIWEVSGNETGFFVRDVTNSSQRPLRVAAGAPTSSLHVDAAGQVGIGTDAPTAALQVEGAAIVNGGFQAGSSRGIKIGFEPVDRRELLARLAALPVESWRYRDDERRARHIGPVAEEFFAAFGLGSSDRHIDLLDSSGVALAALQGVLELLAERDREVARLAERLDELERERPRADRPQRSASSWR